jgi:hypothetical protein
MAKAGPDGPTFPPIAKPTLTAITDAIPFVPGDNVGFAETDKVESDDRKDDNAEDDGDDSNISESSSSKQMEDRFQTAQYLDLWADLQQSSSQMVYSLMMPVLFTVTVYLLTELFNIY